MVNENKKKTVWNAGLVPVLVLRRLERRAEPVLHGVEPVRVQPVPEPRRLRPPTATRPGRRLPLSLPAGYVLLRPLFYRVFFFLPGFYCLFVTVLGFTGFYRVLLGFTRFYWRLLGFTGLGWA